MSGHSINSHPTTSSFHALKSSQDGGSNTYWTDRIKRKMNADLGEFVQYLSNPSEPIMCSHEQGLIQNLENVSSYDLLDEQKDKPSIAIPGYPRIWRDDALRMAIHDTRAPVTDENKSKFPDSPYTPLVHAVMHVRPSFSFQDVDIVTERSVLRKLVGFVKGRLHPEIPPRVRGGGYVKMRFDLQICGQTVLLSKYEPFYSQPEKDIAFEKSFKDRYTTSSEGCENSTAHYRIDRYELGGVKMLVRHQVDATREASPKTRPRGSIDQLIHVTCTDSMRSEEQSDFCVQAIDEDLHILHTRHPAPPQTSLIKLKVRPESSGGEPIDHAESIWLQLYLGQIDNMHIGLHNGNSWTDVKTLTADDLRKEVSEETMEKALPMLSSLLLTLAEEIRDIAAKKSCRLFSLISEYDELHGRRLGVHIRDGGVELPAYLAKSFIGAQGGARL